MTLACEDANSKLVEVVSVADVEAENHVGNFCFSTFRSGVTAVSVKKFS